MVPAVIIQTEEEADNLIFALQSAGGILTPIMDVECISEVNDRLLKECLHYINHAGCIGNRSATVKEMTEQEKPFLTPIPIKRYEVGVHDKAVVNNQQIFHFDSFTYSNPRPYAEKEIGIIAYAFRVVFYHRWKSLHVSTKISNKNGGMTISCQ